jgi:putative hydrolase of the HAD superfamily
MIKGVVFDLGNTLLRFDGDWPTVMEESLGALMDFLHDEGLVFDTAEFQRLFADTHEQDKQVRKSDHVERSTSSLFRQVMEALGYRDLSDEYVARALRIFYEVSEKYWFPMPAAQRVLDELRTRGYRLGLITNAEDQANVQRLIRKGDLEGYFDPIVISSEVGIRKPHPEIFLRVLRQWELPAEQMVMIGDSLREDIAGAQQMGMRQIWIKENIAMSEGQRLIHGIHPEGVALHLDEVPFLIDKLSAGSQRNSNYA